MKLAYMLLSILTLTTFACSRTARGPENDSYSLHGKWKFREFFVSPGDGSQNWQSPPPGETYIEFKPNGTVATDIGGWSSYSTYQSTDSSITLTAKAAANQLMIYYKIEGNTLELKPLCIEGCAYRFTRQ